jgi:hypothetical protein
MVDDSTDRDVEYRTRDFMRSRIPAQDALEAFVPTGSAPDAEMKEVMSRTGFSRWYPIDGGHTLRTLYEGGSYNEQRFTLVKGGWDHEHCSRCGASIEPMTLCWVTRDDPFLLLDEACHETVFGPGADSQAAFRAPSA